MLYNYLKTAIRTISRNRLFSFINVFGLAFSISVCMILIMLLGDQLSYDRYNPNGEHIYRINHSRPVMDPLIEGMATTPMPLAEELISGYPGIHQVSRLYRGFGNDWIKIMQDVNIPISGFYADPNFLNMFAFDLEIGDPETALDEPFNVVLTKESAQRIFNKTNPLGSVVEVGALGNYKVTGVLKEINGKSHIKFDGLASMSSLYALSKKGLAPDDIDSWRNTSDSWTYIQLEEGKSPELLADHLNEISQEQYSKMEDIALSFHLQSILSISPGPLIGNQIGPSIPNFFFYFLFAMAGVIILSSSFNYTNMSLARSLSRSREVGVRKVFGAHKGHIFFQFLVESVLVALLAFLFSFLILFFLKPVFLNLSFSQLLDMQLNQSALVYLTCLSFAIIIGIIAGILPSMFHSSLTPLTGLKKLAGVKVFSRIRTRNALIVVQFGLSVFLIITVRLIYGQMTYMIEKDYGFDADNILVVQMHDADIDKFKNELTKFPSIKNTAAAGIVPATGTSHSRSVFIDQEEKTINHFSIDENYIENMGLTLVAGRGFTSELKETKLMINESAVTYLGFEDAQSAIGEQVHFGDSIIYDLVGVVKDYHHETAFSTIKPLALVYEPDRFSIVQVKINSHDYEQATKDLESVWNALYPDKRIEYKLMSKEIAFFTDMIFGDLVKIISFVALLAIVIACLGLTGMVLYSTQSRLKEVSIRKVLGAGTFSLIGMLASGFIKLLSIALLIFIPLSWYFNHLWLDFIAYRIQPGAGVLLFGIAIVSLLGLFIVGSLSWKTANTDPSVVLRDE